MPSKIKLIKIASEINIGKDTIVEFLRSQGVEIENKPTATLDEAMQELVFEKFKKEKINAEKQREKVLKQKEKKPTSAGEDIAVSDISEVEKTVEATSPLNISVESVKGLSNVIIKTANKPKEAESKDVVVKNVITNDMPDVGNVIVLPNSNYGKAFAKTKPVERDSFKKVTKDENAVSGNILVDSVAQIKTDNLQKPATVKVEAEEKVDSVADSFKPNILVKAKEIVLKSAVAEENSKMPEHKQEEKAVADIEPVVALVGERVYADKIVADEIVIDQTKNEDVLIEGVQETDDDAEGSDDDANDLGVDAKKKKKKKKLIEIRQPGEKMQLKGLTVLGKIELQKPAPPKEKEHRRDGRPERGPGGYRRDGDKNFNQFRDRKNKPDFIKKDDSNASANTGNSNSNSNSNTNTQLQTGDKKFKSRGEGPATPQQRQGGFNSYNNNNNNANSAPKPKVFTTPPAPPKDAKKGIKAHEDKKKRGKSLREMITQEEVDKAIRQTLIGMEGDSYSNAKKLKIKQKKKAVREEKEAKLQEISERESRLLKLTEFVTTSDLANLMNIKPNDVILKCMQLGLMVTINQRLDKDTLLLIADDYGFQVDFIEEDELNDIEVQEDAPETLKPRPPIVTIMGHVDHGKTSLLDHIRNANVVAGEAGGITQHIGAYRVVLKNKKSITFLDTPGHEAFTAMRARGAQVTDIVVLVVAADDSVMPQTIEAISHARAANVPIVVAINKIDKSEANPDRIKQQLSEHGILVEDWGGKNQSVEISAKKGLNIDVLLDKILLEAEMLELKANPDRHASGIVIESKMTKGWGNVATVVMQNGTLFLGDSFVAGANFGKTRALLDERGHKVLDVLPSQPVVVIGFDGLPEAGDLFNAMESETEARNVATKRRQLRREQEMRKVRHTTLDDISAQISIGGVKDLNLIIKGDVAGSVEALSDSLLKLSTEEVRVNILHKGAGTITESDVMLGAASGAVLVGFNVSATPKAMKLAEVESVDIRNYAIIYDCINEIHLALEGMLKPDIKEEIMASVEVRRIFKVGKSGQIAGCYVLSGKITRNDKIRILRNGLPIYSGALNSLKRNKDDVREVDQNYECGIQLDHFNSFEENDVIEAYKLVEIKRTLATKS